MGSIDTYPASFSSTSNAVLGTSTSVTSGAAVTDADTDLSVTISVPTAGRTIRITMVEPNLSGTVASDGFDVKIQEGATVLQDLPWFVITGNIQPRTATVVAITSPSAGVHTYKGHITRFTGTGTLQPLRGAASNAFLIVEDITGGTGGPGPIQLAYAEGTAAQTGISAETTLTFSSVTVSVPAGRRIKISSQVQLASSTTSGTSLLRIKEGATALQVAQGNYNTIGGNGWALRAEVVTTPTAGTHTYFLTVQGTAGTVDLNVGVGVVPYILVEDITGTPSPAGIMPTSQVLAYSQAVANQTGITTEVDLTSLTVTVSVPDGRRIRISGQALWNSTGASPTITMRIREGATELNEYQIVGHPSIGNGASGHIDVVVTPSAGIHTYKLTGAATASSSLLAGTTFPAYIMVEDITGGSPAALPVNVPVGQIGYAEIRASQGSITTEVDIAGLSVNVSVPSGRVLKITSFLFIGDTVTGDEIRTHIKEGSTFLSTTAATSGPTSGFTSMVDSVTISPSAGAHTYKITVNRQSGTGTLTATALSDLPSFILVEDITPTPATATGAPSSILGYSEVTANQAGIVGANSDLTGLTLSVTVTAGRRIKISGHTLSRSTVANDVFQVGIYEGATLINAAKDSVPTTDDLSVDVFAVITPSAGSHTYKLVGLRSSGSGSITVAAGATFPSFILIEDITGVSVPGTPTFSPPSCRVFHNTTQSMADNVETAVVFNSERWDTNGMHDTVSLTNRITIQTSGLYLLTFNGLLPALTTYSYVYSSFRVNGSLSIGYAGFTPTTFNATPILSNTTVYRLNAGDYVEVLVYQDNTANTAQNLTSGGNYSPEFSATWMGTGN